MSRRETAAEKIAKLEAENKKLTIENINLTTRLDYLLETFKLFASKVEMLSRRP